MLRVDSGKTRVGKKNGTSAYRLTRFVLDWWAEFFLSVPTFIGILISAFPQASLTVNGRELAISSTLLLLAMVCGITGGVGVVKKRQSLIALELENEDLRRLASDYANDTKLLLEDNATRLGS